MGYNQGKIKDSFMASTWIWLFSFYSNGMGDMIETLTLLGVCMIFVTLVHWYSEKYLK